ncbi:hypothetical protein BC829DRAFT_443381 [Chytridium lagenaria]|nr:hypothetical protein BC829DRAFT_443381 [Chytridium lagenaria]
MSFALMITLLALPSSISGIQIKTSDGLCWENPGYGIPITLQHCDETLSSQNFTVNSEGRVGGIRVYNDGSCLDLLNMNRTVGAGVGRRMLTKIQVWECKTTMDPRNQMFTLVGSPLLNAFSVKSVLSGLCLDFSTGPRQVGGTLQQRSCTSNMNQTHTFSVTPAVITVGQIETPGGLSIRTSDLLLCLDVVQGDRVGNADPRVNADVIFSDCKTDVSKASSQIFVPTNGVQDDFTGSLANLLTGYCLDLSGNVVHSPGKELGQCPILTSDYPPLCWDLSPNGAVVANTCDVTKSAQWWTLSFGQLLNYNNSRCADFGGSDTSDGVQLGKNGSIIAGHSYKCLSLTNPWLKNHTSGTAVEQQPCSVASGQLFTPLNPYVFRKTNSVTPCTKLSVRKEWRDMTDNEKRRFINAFNEVRKMPSTAGRRSLFDDLVAIHSIAIAYIHQAPVFLPWHRYFLEKLETLLQLVDSSVTIPFWDWGHDGQNPLANTDIFSDSPLGVGTRGDPSASVPCVTGGFARNWTSYFGLCLTRNYTDDFTLYDTSIIAPLTNNTPDFASFAGPLETAHNIVHYYTGGFGTDLFFIDLSPNDPLFFMLHANVDRYWYLWQKAHPNITTQYIGTAQLPPFSQVNVATVAVTIAAYTLLTLAQKSLHFEDAKSKNVKVGRKPDRTSVPVGSATSENGEGDIAEERMMTAMAGALAVEGLSLEGTVADLPAPSAPLVVIRKNEAVLKSLAKQFDDELDKYLASHPTAEYNEASINVLKNWEWKG